MKTAITAIVALIIGAGAMYFFEEGKLANLQSGMSALEAQMAEAKSKADASAAELDQAKAAAAEATKALDAKAQEATALQAKVTELEAALAAAKSGTAQ